MGRLIPSGLKITHHGRGTPMSTINPAAIRVMLGGTVKYVVPIEIKSTSVIKSTDEQISEFKLWEAQTQARSEAIDRYMSQQQFQQPPDKIYGQVVVKGKIFSTVYDSGISSAPYDIPGMPSDGSGTGLAEARLAHIAKAAKGTIIYSDFLPAPASSGSFRAPPESMLPQVTARSLSDMVAEMSWARDRAKMEAELAAK
jgi:hypothetical protein